ncbi:MAG TPA: contact-dependent growth inhibition system immunity protein [Longimicrobium sp.]|nr:contact-dependent growth inhibition system immunity protein [Longimicrobium sp.]
MGTLLDVLSAPGHPDRYVVECSGNDGVSIWLADFLAEEIEPVGDWAAHRERLGQFFGACFHQDWTLEADDWPAVVAQYRSEIGNEQARATADAIDSLPRSVPEEAELERIVHHDLGCDYDPRPDLGGPTVREWLSQVADTLRSPDE